MNLGDHGRHDQAGGLEDPLVVPGAALGTQYVAEQVVLTREEEVHGRETQPPALVKTGDLHAVDGRGQVAVRQHELRPVEEVLHLAYILAVKLRHVPPMGRGVAEEDRRLASDEVRIAGNAHAILLRAADAALPGHPARQGHHHVVHA